MADAREVQIVNAVIAELNDPARTWNGKFTAAPDWMPVYEAPDVQTLQVAVVPLTLDRLRLTRSTNKLDYAVAIDFQQAVNVTNRGARLLACNALTAIVESVFDFFIDAHRLATLPAWCVLAAERPDIYDLHRLYVDNVWESLVAIRVEGEK